MSVVHKRHAFRELLSRMRAFVPHVLCERCRSQILCAVIRGITVNMVNGFRVFIVQPFPDEPMRQKWTKPTQNDYPVAMYVRLPACDLSSKSPIPLRAAISPHLPD